eukprot:gnl/MRDRNA2_/MRDRNA2_75543_c0_seq4.p1 gnl/MRDRNA2_/MRDRNA2_75543_c0~~gnl/MRDRNA2_/MRDRNA2_75543_c0_seq4.p1  ORF type:complete len:149 (-),score=14.27 gnl/MRDRNA2_/MRDRNA2_75543_c0_seq4:34-480(-)
MSNRALLAKALKSPILRWPAFANAHAVLARACVSKSCLCCSVMRKPTVHLCACLTAVVANLPTVLGQVRAMQMLTCCFVMIAKIEKSGASVLKTQTKAHAALAISCGVKTLEQFSVSAAHANVANRTASERTAVANAHAVLISYCTLN